MLFKELNDFKTLWVTEVSVIPAGALSILKNLDVITTLMIRGA